MRSDAQQVSGEGPSGQEFDPLDEARSPSGIGSTGEDRGKGEEELVEESGFDQAADHGGATLRQDDLIPFAPDRGDHIGHVDRSTVAQRHDGRSCRKPIPERGGPETRREDQSPGLQRPMTGVEVSARGEHDQAGSVGATETFPKFRELGCRVGIDVRRCPKRIRRGSQGARTR